MRETTNDDPPAGWNEWLAFEMSEVYGRDVQEVLSAFERGETLDIGLAIHCLASCAFAAGLDAATAKPAAPLDEPHPAAPMTTDGGR